MNDRSGRTIVVNGVTADFGRQILRDSAGRAIELRPQAFAVLRHLSENADRLVTKEELMHAVWPQIAVTDDSLVQCVHEIRRALRDESHTVLQTVPKRGYQLVLPEGASQQVVRTGWVWALPTGLAALLAIAVGSGWFTPPRPSGAVPLVAVLPFEAVAEDERSRLLAKGLTEDAITDLGRFPEFGVLASGSTELYHGDNADPRKAGAELHAAFVVDGSIALEADRVRVNARLIDAVTGGNLWSDRWDRPAADFFTIQSEVAEQIANRLGGGGGLVEETERIKAHRKPPGDLNAYELYLLGSEKMARITRVDMEAAIPLLERAVALDPDFARGWIRLHHAYRQLGVGFGVEPEKNRTLADAAAERALILDPGDPEAHAVMGWSLGDRGQHSRANAEFETALAMAPNAVDILTQYADWTPTFGKPERGVALIERVIRLEPNYPVWKARDFAYIYFMAAHYEQSLAMIARLTPENYWRDTWAFRAGSLAALGRVDEAQVISKEAAVARPDLNIEVLINDPGYGDIEHKRFLETLRPAGFSACAAADVLAKLEKPLRLPECDAKADTAVR